MKWLSGMDSLRPRHRRAGRLLTATAYTLQHPAGLTELSSAPAYARAGPGSRPEPITRRPAGACAKV